MKNFLVFTILLFSCSVFAQKKNNDYPVNPNFEDIDIESTVVDCDGPRPDIWDFTAAEREQLRDCMMEYLTQENPDWEVGDPLRELYPIIWDHTRNGAAAFWHNNSEVGFFTEHRTYIAGMEDFLLANGCEAFVPLPKYDPSTGIPDEFFDDLAVVDGFGSLNNQFPNYDMIVVNENTCTEFEDIDDFANHVEQQHNAVHGLIGGAMGNFDSPSAAIFWLWHSKVDDMYSCFQQECQCPQVDITATLSLCDYCFDISESTNTDAITIVLYDGNGNPVSVTLDENHCISLDQLIINSPYTVDVTAVNTAMVDNIECDNATQSFSFFNPTPPYKDAGCSDVTATQKITNSSGPTQFTISNTGKSRLFNISTVAINTGTVYTLVNSVYIESGQEIEVEIPNSMSRVGNNQLVILFEGKSVNVNYFSNQ